MLFTLFYSFFMLSGALSPANPFDKPDPEVVKIIVSGNIPSESDVTVLKSDTFVTVRDSGASETYVRKVYKPNTAKGLSALTVHRFDFDTATNMVNVSGVYKYTSAGKRLPVKYSVVTEPQPAGWILWKFKMKILTVPMLNPGESLEIITVKKGFMIAYLDATPDKYVPPMRGHFYDQVLFGEKYPVLLQKYTVKIPGNKNLRYSEYGKGILNSVKYENNSVFYTWYMKNVPPLHYEKRAPYPSDNLPKVVMTTVATWHAKSRWFYDVNKNQFKVSPEIRKKTAEILRGVTKREDKIRKLTYWVANNIRYRGFSNGPKEGYTLHSGIQVFRERAGVCKDIASMLVTMLRAAGFTVYPAMTMAGARVENIPADQFNHSVVALRNPDGTYRMLDPTWAPVSRYTWSYAERMQNYLVGSPQGEDLSIIPASKPEENLILLDVKTGVSKNGSFVSSVKIKSHGYPETSLRRFFASVSSVETKREGDFFLKKNPALTLLKFSRSDIFNFDKDLKIKMKIKGNGLFYPHSKGIIFKPYVFTGYPEVGGRLMIWLRLKPGKRTRDVLLRSNQKISFRETLIFPRKIVFEGKTEGKYGNKTGKLTWKYEVKGKKLVFKSDFIIYRRRIRVDEYADFMKLTGAFKKMMNSYVSVLYK